MAVDEVTRLGAERNQIAVQTVCPIVQLKFGSEVVRLNVMHLEIGVSPAGDAGRLPGKMFSSHPGPLP